MGLDRQDMDGLELDGHDMAWKWMDMTWTGHEWGSTDGT